MEEQAKRMEKQDKKKRPRRHKEDWVVKRPVLTSIMIVVGLLLLSYGLLFILTLIDRKTTNILPNAFTRLEGGVDEWFAFYTGFIGIGVSIVLGIITHRLSVKVDRMDKFSKIREITAEWIRLYDLWRGFKPSVVQYNDLSSRFVLEIKLNDFPSYYTVDVESVIWGGIDKEYKEKEGSELKGLKTYIESGKEHIIHLYFDDFAPVDELATQQQEEKELSFHYYFRQSCFNPIIRYPYERQRYLKIRMKMKEPLSNERTETIMVEMCIFVENGGYNKERYIDLVQKKYTVKIEQL